MKKPIKTGIYILGAGALIALVVGLYLFNLPHRNIQETKTDIQISAASLTKEFLENPAEANLKYLDAEGESKVLEVTGEVANVSEDFNKNLVVLLKSSGQPAGVSCTFLSSAGLNQNSFSTGQEIKVKGVIRSGASYDADLGFYEHVILDKCALLTKI